MASPNLIAVPIDEKTVIYIETTNSDSDDYESTFANISSDRNGNVLERAKGYLDEKMIQVKAFASNVSKAFLEMDNKPNEFEIEFAVKFAAEAGVVISSVNSEAGIIVKLKWSKDKDG